jgi:hypothetical protein
MSIRAAGIKSGAASGAFAAQAALLLDTVAPWRRPP